MPNQKLTELTELTALTADDLIYVVNDPDGTPASRSAAISLLLGGTLGTYGGNLIKNSPGQIVTDGAEPQWWDSSGSATLTDEDAAGEGIPEITERVFKVVTVANDHYGYGTSTFADESLLDAGQTTVSFGCWVYATAVNASIGIFGTNLGLQESSQHTGDSTWQWLSINNITLNGADTDIETRLIVDTGTAYFTMPMLNAGPVAGSWQNRGEIYIPTQNSTQYDLNPTGDVAWSDTDCTANSDALATGVSIFLIVRENDGTISSSHQVGHNDALVGGDFLAAVQYVNVVSAALWIGASHNSIRCDDSQVIRYQIDEIDADSDMRCILFITGYWRWL
jgi:hypothetical protein